MYTLLALRPGCAGKDDSADNETDTDTDTDADTDTPNLVTNGDFATDTTGWMPINAVLTVQDGAVRVSTETDKSGPGLATQVLSLTKGEAYVLSATLIDGTYPGSFHIRAGLDTNLDDYGTVHDTKVPLYFTATTSAVTLTLNNVGAAIDDFALFDDVALRAVTE